MAVARFKVEGRFDGASSATIEVHRERGFVTVRPLRRRRTYSVTLAEVAEFVIWRSLRKEGAIVPAARRKHLRSV